MDRGAYNAIWQNCLGKSFIRRDKSWDNSKFDTLGLRELKSMTMQSILAQTGGSVKSRGETCRPLRPRQQIGIETIGRRAIGIPSFLHGLKICEKNSQSLDQFRLSGEKPPDNRLKMWTVHPQIQHVQMRTVWSHFITRTRVAQDSTSLCPKIVVIHVSSLVPCRTWHWPQAQVLSHLPHLSSSRSLPHTQVLWRTIHIYPAKIHGRVADQQKSAGTLEDRGQGRQPVCKKRIDVYDGRGGRASKRLCICVEDRCLRRGEPKAHFRNFEDDVVNNMTTPLEDDESVLFGYIARYRWPRWTNENYTVGP